jgi:RHS repeat-associated core domain
VNNLNEWEFDVLGRVTKVTNNLGTFTIPSFDGGSSRPTKIKYPNGQRTEIGCYSNGDDRRLKVIRDLNQNGNLISKFDYLNYARDGEIRRLEKTLDNGLKHRFVYEYDRINQLKKAKQVDLVNAGVVNSYVYKYDAAGNRISYRDNLMTVQAKYDKLNQVRLMVGGAADEEVSGFLNKPARVTVNGEPVDVDDENHFQTYVPGSGPATPLSITATDFDGNPPVTGNWTFSSSQGVGGRFTYSGGNLTDQKFPKPVQYTWDGEDRLKTVTVDGTTYEFIYDGFSRRIMEKVNGTPSRTWVWSGLEIVEERAGNGSTVLKRFYPQGEEWGTGTEAKDYYYTFDHLGSIQEMTDSNRNIVARYAYSPWGETTKIQGTLDASFTYTGHFMHHPTGLVLAPYRAYDPSLGRWLSRDPIGENGGINLGLS